MKNYRLFRLGLRLFLLPSIRRVITTMMHSTTIGVRITAAGSCVKKFNASATFSLKVIMAQLTDGTCSDKNSLVISNEYQAVLRSQSITSASVPQGSDIGQLPSCILGLVSAHKNT